MRLLIIICCILPFIARAQVYQTPVLDWSSLLGGGGQEEIMDITQLPDGRIAAVGFTTSKLYKKEDQYYFIVDADGKKIVERNFGSEQDDRALGLTGTYDGRLIYVGYVQIAGNFKTHKIPTLRKIDQNGNPVYSVIASTMDGYYKDIIELRPRQSIVIGQDNGKAVIAQYHNDSIEWLKIIPASVELNTIQAVSDSTFLVAGVALADDLAWYALYNDRGEQLWAKKGQKYYGAAKAIALENNKVAWLGGSYNDARTREDAYIMKINLKDGALLVKTNLGGRYDDVFTSFVLTPDDKAYIGGKTYSHLRGGAKRSKAWMVQIDASSLKPIGDQYLWGGKQNNEITSMILSSDQRLILGAFTTSGEADRQDAWVMEIPTIEDQSEMMVPGLRIQELNVLDENGDGKIGYTESSTFQLSYQRTKDRIAGFPKFIVYINGEKVAYDVLLNPSLQEDVFNIPYYRESELIGSHQVKIILLDGKNQRLDSIEKTVEFLPSDQSRIQFAFGVPVLRKTLDHGLPVISVPLSIKNISNGNLSDIKPNIILQEEIPYTIADTLLSIKSKESVTTMIELRPQEILTTDSVVLKVMAQYQAQIFSGVTTLPVKELLDPWVKARKEQTTVLIAEKLASKSFDQTGSISPLASEDYKKLPLDSFFLKQNTWKLEHGTVSSALKSFDPDKLNILWIDPDPVVTKNYFIAKRNKHALLLKLITQDQNADGLEPKLIIERPGRGIIDTVVMQLDQGVLLGSYQYNLQADIPLVEGENKISLSLWYRDELIKSSVKMIFKYEPPKSNLFVMAYGIPSGGLAQVSKDAADLAAAFNTQQGKLFSTIQTQVFNTPAQTATQEIKKSIRSIANDYFDFKRIKKNDVILIYISAHGSLIRDMLHIHASDYDPIYEDETTLSFQKDIQDKLKDIPCKKIFLIDACHSGAAGQVAAIADGIKGTEEDDLATALIKLSDASNDFYYLLSSSAGEVSYTDDSWGNSAFTKGILEALHDQSESTLQGIQHADEDGNRIIDLKEIFEYLQERVPVIIQSKKNLRSTQTPYTPNRTALKEIAIYVLEK